MKTAAEPPPGDAQAHALLDALFSTSPAGLGFYDLDIRCVRMNAALAAITGVPVDEVIGRRPDEYLPPPMGERILASFRRVLETGAPNVEFEISGETRSAPGRRRHWLATHYPVPGPDGKPVGVGAIVNEITRRKESEEAFRLADARLRTLLQTLPVGVVIADASGRITQNNDAAERIWGRVPRLDMERYREYRGFWPDGRPIGSQEWALARALSRGESSFGEVVRIINFDEEPKTILNNGAPLRDADGRIFGAVVAFQDISDVTRIEEEQRFLAEAGVALASSLDWEATLRRIAELAVPRLADWCSVDLVEGETVRPLAIVHRELPNLRATAQVRQRYPADAVPDHPVARAIRSGAPVMAPRFDDLLDSFAREPEYRRLVVALGLRSYMVVPLVARGRTLGAITFITTQSDETGAPGRTLGPRDLALAEELARRAAFAVDNAQLYREAQEATRLRENVLAVVSHDLQNPLSAILVTCKLLERALAAGRTSPPERVKAIESAAKRMSRMVADLVDLAALRAGHFRVERTSQSPAELVAASVAQLAPLAEEKKVALSCAASPDLPALGCDRDRVLQVLSNLIGNAIKVTEAGGQIVVSAEVSASVPRSDSSEPSPDTAVSSSIPDADPAGVAGAFGAGGPPGPQAAEVTFAVRDTGPGIPDAELPHLFERFWRARETGYRGTGLGLAISRALVEAHGGRIWARSRVGEGSTFYFALPLVAG